MPGTPPIAAPGFGGSGMDTSPDTKRGTVWPRLEAGGLGRATGRQRPEDGGWGWVGGGVRWAKPLPVGTPRVKAALNPGCVLRPQSAWILGYYVESRRPRVSGSLGDRVQASVRAVGPGRPGANGLCSLLPRERRAGGRRRPGSCPGPCPPHAARRLHDRQGPPGPPRCLAAAAEPWRQRGRVGPQPRSTCPSTSISDPLPRDEGPGVCSLQGHLPGRGPESPGEGTPES